jgi:hypothetical protein
MIAEHASLVLSLGALAASACLFALTIRLHRQARQLGKSLAASQAALDALLASTHRQSDQVEAAISRAQEIKTESRDILASIDELAELTDLATILPALSTNAPNLFNDNNTSLAVARLADQGHPPAYISKRLGLPLGEVELLLSLRP